MRGSLTTAMAVAMQRPRTLKSSRDRAPKFKKVSRAQTANASSEFSNWNTNPLKMFEDNDMSVEKSPNLVYPVEIMQETADVLGVEVEKVSI